MVRMCIFVFLKLFKVHVYSHLLIISEFDIRMREQTSLFSFKIFFENNRNGLFGAKHKTE